MSTGGSLGGFGVTSNATAPRSKIMWLQEARWWNSLCTMLLHAGPENNMIGDYHPAFGFNAPTGGDCSVCIVPVQVELE